MSNNVDGIYDQLEEYRRGHIERDHISDKSYRASDICLLFYCLRLSTIVNESTNKEFACVSNEKKRTKTHGHYRILIARQMREREKKREP
jgi:hypothetical protein